MGGVRGGWLAFSLHPHLASPSRWRNPLFEIPEIKFSIAGKVKFRCKAASTIVIPLIFIFIEPMGGCLSHIQCHIKLFCPDGKIFVHNLGRLAGVSRTMQ